MSGKSLNEFKYALEKYSVHQLRPCARAIGVASPTTKNLEPLVDAIIAVLTGEVAPVVPSGRGKPVKNDQVDQEIINLMEEFRLQYASNALPKKEEIPVNRVETGAEEMARRFAEFKAQHHTMRVEDPNAPKEIRIENGKLPDVYLGQLTTLHNVSLLLSLNCFDNEEKIIIPVELIHKHDLREGDVVSCFAQKSKTALVATEILTIAGMDVKSLRRIKFEETMASYPSKRIQLFDCEKANSLAMKYVQWLLPLGRGQRGCILSSPKAGKTNILYEIAHNAKRLNENLTTLVLLIDQSPENVTRFRKIIKSDNLLYTTYDDDAERQVFVANFILNRAKRLAECGKDVLLIVDSFSALAHAYNQTNDSIGGKTFQGGLESKTLQYIKKYFGAARCFERGGSITMIGAVSNQTGNPADELIATELTAIDNWEMQLSDTLAVKRMYPAIDFTHSQVKQAESFFQDDEKSMDYFLRNEYVSTYGEVALRTALDESTAYGEFVKRIK